MNIAVVELGLSLENFYNLSPYEVASLHNCKLEKDKVKYINIRNAFLNAYCNANRGKKEKFYPLYPEDQKRKKKKHMTREEIIEDRKDFFKMLEDLGEM